LLCSRTNGSPLFRLKDSRARVCASLFYSRQKKIAELVRHAFISRLTLAAFSELTEILMRRVACLLISLFVLTLASAAAQELRSAKDYVKRGIARFSRGDIEGALSDYNQALQLNPRYSDALLNRGKARRAIGDLEGAIEDYERAIDLDPRLPYNNQDITQAYANRGFIRANELDIDGAIDDFDKAIKFFPTAADSYIKRGEARLVKGDLDAAVNDFDKAILLNPRGPSTSLAYAGRGYARLLQGKEDEARRDFDKSVRLNGEGKIFLELHLRILDSQIKELKRRRAEAQPKIA
jgi:tetratricopeptide (TPR) repeat protein